LADETTTTGTSETATSEATALNGEVAGAPATETQGTETALGGGEVAKTPEQVAADEAAAAEAAKAAVPETYELAAPEGTTLDPESIALATPVFKELGLSNEQANKLMPVAAQFAQRIQDQANQQIISQVQADRKAWLDTAKADPEIGGAKWDETIATGAKALDGLGFPKGSPFRVLLEESGLGNHPEMIRAWSKVGRAIGEDGFVQASGVTTTKRDTAELLYPNDAPKGGQ
jgi:hypothetical protein